MKTRSSGVNHVLLLSVSFTMALLAARIMYTRELTYAFYPWNIFLAAIPLLCSSRLLKQNKPGIEAFLCLMVWLLFLPNAPYLITDLFHFTKRDGCPAWFDLVLVSSGSWNGIVLSTVSLIRVERFLKRHLPDKSVHISLAFVIILCGYGVYLGRFLRFNSWDVVTNPGGLASYIKNSLVHPHQNISAWAFTIVFSLMFGIIFLTIKRLRAETGNHKK